jgi:uncharacterized UBP type Zn finger protein
MKKMKENQALLDDDDQDITNEIGYIPQDVISKQTFDETKKNLLETIRVLRKEMSDSQLNFDHERDLFNEELSKKDDLIAERDNEILALKDSNPDVIVKGEIYSV